MRGLLNAALDSQELTTPQGPYDPKERRLQIDMFKPRAWGVHDTSSKKPPGAWYWLPSGAAHLNTIVTYRTFINAFFNEVRRPLSLLRSSFFWGLYLVKGRSLDCSVRFTSQFPCLDVRYRKSCHCESVVDVVVVTIPCTRCNLI